LLILLKGRQCCKVHSTASLGTMILPVYHLSYK
jgi:hypothetical protein